MEVERITDEVAVTEGVLVNGRCVPVDELCSNWRPRSEVPRVNLIIEWNSVQYSDLA